MPYIIDGHNLIAKIPALALDEIDDEMHLVRMLQEFCRQKRKQVYVYFDNAPPGGSRVRGFGLVTAYFIRQGNTADREMERKLRRLGGEARNYTVVSSDRTVQAAGRAVRAQILTSEDFAKRLMEVLEPQNSENEGAPESMLSADEIEDWLQIFGDGEEREG